MLFGAYSLVLCCRETFSWGCNLMAETKKIMVSIPDSLLKEVDFIVSMEKKNRKRVCKRSYEILPPLKKDEWSFLKGLKMGTWKWLKLIQPWQK